jgi:hypothetical protein
VTVSASDATASLPSPVLFDVGATGRVVVDVTFNAIGTHTVSVVDDDARSGTSASIVVAERPPVPSVLLPVAGDGQRAVAGTAYTTALELVVKDSRGRVVPDAEVAFAVVGGNAVVGQDRAFADAAGVVRASVVAGTQAGEDRVRASLAVAPDVAAAFALTSLPGPVAAVTATVPVSTVQDCTPAALVLVARDAYGNVATDAVDIAVDVVALDGAPVIVSTSLVGGTSGGGATTGALVGMAQVEVQLDAVADAFVTWSAPSLGLGGSEPISFVAGPLSLQDSRVVASAELARGGGDEVVVTVTPVDECGAAIGDGHAIVAAASYGTITDAVAVGDGSFEASFHLGESECHNDPATIVLRRARHRGRRGRRRRALRSARRRVVARAFAPHAAFRDVGDEDASTELFDPTTNTFAAGAPLPVARFAHSATRLPDGAVLVVGGFSGGSLADAYVYRPTPGGPGAFTSTGSMATSRGGHLAIPLGRDVLVVGGQGVFPVASAERWSSSTGTFGPAGTMTSARSAHTGGLMPDGSVLVVGGFNGTKALATTERWSSPQTFTADATLAEVRMNVGAALLPSGGLAVVGGRNETTRYATTDELYNPTTLAFTSAGAAAVREAPAATPLGAGRVLVTGGIDSATNRLATVELLDAQTTTTTAAIALPAVLSRHTVTLLGDGPVLVVGGTTNGSTALAAARIYDPTSDTYATTGR